MAQIDINGYRMHYTDRGEGTAIVFIHPPVLSSKNFVYQIAGLSPSYRTIAIDIRGHGESEASKEAVTYPLIVQDILVLMNRLNVEKAFVCGYSTGGSVVLEFLLAHPDRAWGGIVIGGMSEVSDRKLRFKVAFGRILSRLGATGLIALSTARSNAGGRYFLFRKLFGDARKASARNAEQYYRYSQHYNCTAQLEHIRRPVLLLYGGGDKLFKPYARLLHDRLPDSELVFINGADHRLPTKKAEQVNTLIRRFMQKHAGSVLHPRWRNAVQPNGDVGHPVGEEQDAHQQHDGAADFHDGL